MSSMVSDITTDTLIYWSDSGDSFFGKSRLTSSACRAKLMGQCRIMNDLGKRFYLDSSNIPTFQVSSDS